jgi:uncharacterized protein YbaR (Trm112 family)
MPLNPKLRELLVCPKCHGPLTVQGSDEALDCPACQLRYKIERYPNEVLIPNMIIEQAEDLTGKGHGQG